MPNYDVHVLAVVRVKVAGVEAQDQRSAIETAEKAIWDHSSIFEIGPQYLGNGLRVVDLELAEDENPTGYLVDEEGDEEHERSTWYNADRTPWIPELDIFRSGKRMPGYTRLELTFIATILMLMALTVGLMYASENSVISQELDEPVRLVQLVEGPGGGLYYSGCQTDVECEDEWRELLRARGVVHDIRAHAGHFDATLTLTAGNRDFRLSEFESAEAIREWAEEHNYTVGGR